MESSHRGNGTWVGGRINRPTNPTSSRFGSVLGAVFKKRAKGSLEPGPDEIKRGLG